MALVRRIKHRGDLETWLALAHPEIEFRTSGVFPGVDPVYRGRIELHRFWSEFREPWESLNLDVHQVLEAGDDVVGLWTFRGRARDGMRVEREAGSVWHFVNRLAIRLENYGSWNEALEAAGLRE